MDLLLLRYSQNDVDELEVVIQFQERGLHRVSFFKLVKVEKCKQLIRLQMERLIIAHTFRIQLKRSPLCLKREEKDSPKCNFNHLTSWH